MSIKDWFMFETLLCPAEGGSILHPNTLGPAYNVYRGFNGTREKWGWLR